MGHVQKVIADFPLLDECMIGAWQPAHPTPREPAGSSPFFVLRGEIQGHDGMYVVPFLFSTAR
jgi:hypothetical protein